MADQTPAQKAEEEKRKAEEAKRKAEQAKHEQTKHHGKPLAYSPAAGGHSVLPTEPPRDLNLSADEIKSMAGDLEPGEVGFLKLDENGDPQGAATRELPHVGDEEPVARVIASPTRKYDEIVTPSGAPVTKQMNPEPALWDEGMLARNPVPEKSERLKNAKVPAGAPVLNQPVLT